MNHKQFYDAWIRSKLIYGLDSIHIQLIAKQLGVLASEAVEYVLNNPTLIEYRTRKPSSGIMNTDEDYFGMYIYSVSAIPFVSTVSTVREGDNGATIILSIAGDTFKSSTSILNFGVDAGNTGLTLDSCSGSGATKTLVFTGTAKTGTITIYAKAAGLDGTVDSDIVEIAVEAKSLDFATLDLAIPSLGTVVTAVAETGSIELDTGISLDFTNKVKGDIGLTVSLINPEEDTEEEVVSVSGNTISVVLAYDTGAITSTAATVKAAIEAHEIAASMVSVAITGLDSTLAIEADVTLSSGVNGTAAKTGKILIDSTKIWIAVADCYTYNTDGWKSIAFDS